MAGSLVRLLAGDDEDPTELEIAELASVSTKHFETQLRAWKYSRGPRTGTGEGMGDIELDVQPSPIELGRARAFYNAARIHAKIIFSRDHSNELWLESHKAATAPQSAPAPATIQIVRQPMTPDRNVDGDMAKVPFFHYFLSLILKKGRRGGARGASLDKLLYFDIFHYIYWGVGYVGSHFSCFVSGHFLRGPQFSGNRRAIGWECVIYAHICAYMRTQCIYAHIYAYIYAYMHTHMHYMLAYMHICARICI